MGDVAGVTNTMVVKGSYAWPHYWWSVPHILGLTSWHRVPKDLACSYGERCGGDPGGEQAWRYGEACFLYPLVTYETLSLEVR